MTLERGHPLEYIAKSQHVLVDTIEPVEECGNYKDCLKITLIHMKEVCGDMPKDLVDFMPIQGSLLVSLDKRCFYVLDSPKAGTVIVKEGDKKFNQ